jgi:hypothetical protein
LVPDDDAARQAAASAVLERTNRLAARYGLSSGSTPLTPAANGGGAPGASGPHHDDFRDWDNTGESPAALPAGNAPAPSAPGVPARAQGWDNTDKG